jgi:hypothetical protein
MDKYEIAILRVLLKNRDSIRISELVYGFPDNSTDFVFFAIESLKSLGYVRSDDFGEYLSLSREKREEAISVVYPDYSSDLNNNYLYSRKSEKKESSQRPTPRSKSYSHADWGDSHLFQTMLAGITILGVSFVVLSSILSQSLYTSVNTMTPPPLGQQEVYLAAIPMLPDQPHVIPQGEPLEDSLVFFAMPPGMLENRNELQSQRNIVIEPSFEEFSLVPRVEIIDNNMRATE